MKTVFVGLLISALVASNALRTEQEPDKIVYQGKKHLLFAYPMEPYFEKHPEKRPQAEVGSSALSRGYVATFEVKERRLVLRDVEIMMRSTTRDGEFDTAWKSVMGEIVPKGQVLAIDWFTGIFVLGHGKRLKQAYLGFGPTWSNYILLEITGGKITGERKLDYREYVQFRERQFLAYTKTEAYREKVAHLKKEGWSQEKSDSFLRIWILEYTSEFLDQKEPVKKPTERNVK